MYIVCVCGCVWYALMSHHVFAPPLWILSAPLLSCLVDVATKTRHLCRSRIDGVKNETWYWQPRFQRIGMAQPTTTYQKHG